MRVRGFGIAQATLDIVSSLDGFETTNERRSGNTTRLIDACVQIIFQGKTCLVKDHDLRGTNVKMNRYLFQRVKRRFETEHQAVLDYVCFDFKNLAIYIFRSLDEKKRVYAEESKRDSRKF